MKVEKSIFDVTTHTRGTKQIIDINRFCYVKRLIFMNYSELFNYHYESDLKLSN